jgi:hypothetical protein
MDQYPNSNAWGFPFSGKATPYNQTGTVKVVEITKTEVASPSSQPAPVHRISSILPTAVGAAPASVADLEAAWLRADTTPVGSTLRTLYELEIKRRKEQEPEAEAPTERETIVKSQHGFELSRREEGPQVVDDHASLLRTQHDQEMAQRQLRIEALSRGEREEQERWAQAQLMLRGSCHRGFQWIRVPGGYRCEGHNHAVTDELLAEGRGGWYERDQVLFRVRGIERWLGPVYSQEEMLQVAEEMARRAVLEGPVPGFHPGLRRRYY